MFSRESLLIGSKEKIFRLRLLQTNTSDDQYAIGIPRNNEERFFGSIELGENFLEGNTQVKLQVPNTLRYSSYSISGYGVSVAHFDRWDSIMIFNIMSSGVDATISFTIDVGSG